MAKKKQFAPHIYPEWGELFANLSDKQNAEILKAITQFPNYEPENNPIWNFIKSQIEKDYEIFIDKCSKNESIIRNYWQKKKTNDNKSRTDDYECIRTNTNDYECIPKRITNNEITNNELRITQTKTETKIDYLTNPIINQVFSIYQTHCNNLTGLGKYYKRDVELKKLVGLYLEQTESNLEYFTQVCDIANKLIKIGSCKLDLKMVMNNHSGIYNGKYAPQDNEEDDGYSSHDDSEWIKKLEQEEPETWKVLY